MDTNAKSLGFFVGRRLIAFHLKSIYLVSGSAMARLTWANRLQAEPMHKSAHPCTQQNPTTVLVNYLHPCFKVQLRVREQPKKDQGWSVISPTFH